MRRRAARARPGVKEGRQKLAWGGGGGRKATLGCAGILARAPECMRMLLAVGTDDDDTAKFCKSVFAQKLFLMSFGGARISHQRRERERERETLLMASCRLPADRASLRKWALFYARRDGE